VRGIQSLFFNLNRQKFLAWSPFLDDKVGKQKEAYVPAKDAFLLGIKVEKARVILDFCRKTIEETIVLNYD